MFGGISFQDFVKGRKAAGVEVEFLNEGFRINMASLRRRKGNLDLVSSAFDVGGLDQLKSSISPDVPLFLAVTGKGVINKIADIEANEHLNSILHKALPNANPEEFYLQTTGMANGHAIISVIRKSMVDNLLILFKNSGYFVVGITFGPHAFSAILPWIDKADNGNDTPEGKAVNINGHILKVRNNEWCDYSFEWNDETKRIEIGGEEIDQRCALAFASAFGFFTSAQEELPVPEVIEQKNEFMSKRIFHFAGVATLVFFFSFLLVNFFLFNYYNTLAGNLNTRVFKSKDELINISSMESELLHKQKFLGQMGLLESSKTSFYADRIAFDLPREIQLSEMFFNPVERNINAGKKELKFLSKTINVAGKCKKITEFNKWVKLLKEKEWIEAVDVLNYSQEKASESGIFQISVKLK